MIGCFEIGRICLLRLSGVKLGNYIGAYLNKSAQITQKIAKNFLLVLVADLPTQTPTYRHR